MSSYDVPSVTCRIFIFVTQISIFVMKYYETLNIGTKSGHVGWAKSILLVVGQSEQVPHCLSIHH